MVDLLKKYVPSSLLFTTDGASDGMVKCGSTNRTYTTVDFGPGGDPSHSFAVQRKYQPKGPLVRKFSLLGAAHKAEGRMVWPDQLVSI